MLLGQADVRVVARGAAAQAHVGRGEELAAGEGRGPARRLARHLRAAGVGTEKLVGIYLGRSPEMVIAVLATLKAGAAYLPLSTSLPQARLSQLLAEARPSVVLTLSSLRGQLPEGEVSVLCLDAGGECLDDDNAAASPYGTGSLSVRVAPESAAYVIYTSG
ncbi:MAG TPA: AMP-binding protein, partial [Pyrinomonadaceae bacterium]|nr:AMP-binding protein [Pyrinomonadaceae bacterium]